MIATKRPLQNAAGCFRPGGWLLAAEGYSEEGSDMQEWFFEEMESRRRAIDLELSDFVAQLRDEKETHYYCSKAEKAEWWRQAGYMQVNYALAVSLHCSDGWVKSPFKNQKPAK